MKTVLAAVVLAMGALFLHAERVYLKNGDVVTGKIVETTETSITVETEQGRIEIPKGKIDKVDYAATDQDARLKERNSSLIWRPLPSVIGALLGVVEIVAEGQTAFAKYLSGTVLLDVGAVGPVYFLWTQIGPQLRPSGRYLHGFVLGLYPGLGFMTTFRGYTLWFGSGTFEAGYQWVWQSGFTLGLTDGLSYLVGTPYLGPLKVNASVHFGFVYKDPVFRAK